MVISSVSGKSFSGRGSGQEVGIRNGSLGYAVLHNFSGQERERVDSRRSSDVEQFGVEVNSEPMNTVNGAGVGVTILQWRNLGTWWDVRKY